MDSNARFIGYSIIFFAVFVGLMFWYDTKHPVERTCPDGLTLSFIPNSHPGYVCVVVPTVKSK